MLGENNFARIKIMAANDYVLYFTDIESNGLDSRVHSPIEISLYRLSDDVQKTWFLKPLDVDSSQEQALKINEHKLEDLRGETKYGRDTYMDPNKVLVEIEEFVLDDGVPTSNRCLVGQNVSFDKDMLQQLWIRCGVGDSFPFGRRYLDTMIIEMAMDYAKGTMAEGYSLANLTKKYGIKNSKAHSSEADTKATKEVFDKQIALLKSLLAKQ
jgi:DNA polymerase III epsilon subunit-like protein